MKITLPGEFCDLNTYINAERRNRFLASKIKKEETERVYYLTIGKKLLPGIEFPLIVEFTLFVKDLRKDADNLQFSAKFWGDGLVMAGVIPDDSRKYIKFWRVKDILVDKNNPRVEMVFKTYQQENL